MIVLRVESAHGHGPYCPTENGWTDVPTEWGLASAAHPSMWMDFGTGRYAGTGTTWEQVFLDAVGVDDINPPTARDVIRFGFTSLMQFRIWWSSKELTWLAAHECRLVFFDVDERWVGTAARQCCFYLTKARRVCELSITATDEEIERAMRNT